MTEPVPSQIANACVGREIRVLQPTECDEQGRTMNALLAYDSCDVCLFEGGGGG